MTQENKKLLLKDLSARLPYEVKVHAKYVDTDNEVEKDGVLSMIDCDAVVAFTCDDTNCFNYVAINEVKPYLFPLSSMTEEEMKELLQISNFNSDIDEICDDFIISIERTSIDIVDIVNFISYLNAHHFDYRGLIEKGLAIDASNLNIY